MQISTIKNLNLEKPSRNPSYRTIVKILKKKFFWISLKKNLVPRMLSHRGNVRTSNFWRKLKDNVRRCLEWDFYRKRLPQQQRDRWIGERETSTHWLHVGRRWVRAIPPHPPLTCDKRQGLGALQLPPPSIVHKQANF